jgi:hypothetical protein
MNWVRFRVAPSYVMLPFVLVYFRAFPKTVGGSVRHACDTDGPMSGRVRRLLKQGNKRFAGRLVGADLFVVFVKGPKATS